MKEYTVFISGDESAFRSVKIKADSCEFTASSLILTQGGKIVAQFLNSKIAGFVQSDQIL